MILIFYGSQAIMFCTCTLKNFKIIGKNERDHRETKNGLKWPLLFFPMILIFLWLPSHDVLYLHLKKIKIIGKNKRDHRETKNGLKWFLLFSQWF